MERERGREGLIHLSITHMTQAEERPQNESRIDGARETTEREKGQGEKERKRGRERE